MISDSCTVAVGMEIFYEDLGVNGCFVSFKELDGEDVEFAFCEGSW